MFDPSICSTCHHKGARIWAVSGVDVVYCVACCPLSANAFPAVWEGERLKTPTQITTEELEAWSALPLWPLELQRAWLLRQLEPIAVAGAQLAASGHGDWSRPIRSYLGPELRSVAAARGLGVESLSPEDWEDFAARFDMLISIARVQARKGPPQRLPRADEAVSVHLGSIGWGRGSDLPWQGVEGEMVSTYLADFLRARLQASGEWHAVETLEIHRSRQRLALHASSPVVQARWMIRLRALIAEFLDPSTRDGWASVFELAGAARTSKGSN